LTYTDRIFLLVIVLTKRRFVVMCHTSGIEAVFVKV